MQSYASVIEAWPSAVICADDIGVNPITVRSWKLRGIPAEHWQALVRAAEKRRELAHKAGDGDAARRFAAITLDRLARLAALSRPRRRRKAA